MKKIFNARWYEYVFNMVCLVILITLGIVFDSSPLIISVNVISIVMMLFVSKGNIIGSILQIFNATLYSIVSFQSSYYGEFICCIFITIPLTIFTAISWLKNRNDNSSTINVGKIQIKEWLILAFTSIPVFIGVYFLLRAFNTLNLIVSAVSLTLGLYANYLMMRRCEFTFIVFIVNNIVCITLWLMLTINSIIYLPLVANYCILLVYNLIALTNWIKLKKKRRIYE